MVHTNTSFSENPILVLNSARTLISEKDVFVCTIFYENLQILKGIILPSCQDFFYLASFNSILKILENTFTTLWTICRVWFFSNFFFICYYHHQRGLYLIYLAARMKISVWRRADFKKKKKLAASGNSPFDLLINTFQMFEWCGHSLR